MKFNRLLLFFSFWAIALTHCAQQTSNFSNDPGGGALDAQTVGSTGGSNYSPPTPRGTPQGDPWQLVCRYIAEDVCLRWVYAKYSGQEGDNGQWVQLKGGLIVTRHLPGYIQDLEGIQKVIPASVDVSKLQNAKVTLSSEEKTPSSTSDENGCFYFSFLANAGDSVKLTVEKPSGQTFDQPLPVSFEFDLPPTTPLSPQEMSFAGPCKPYEVVPNGSETY